MRKLSSIIIIASAVFLLNSCLGNKDYTFGGGASQGIQLYYGANLENRLAMDPIVAAFKLNTLLETTASQMGYTDFEDIQVEDFADVKVTVNTVERNLKTYLFGGNTLEKLGSGNWNIKFIEGVTSDIDGESKSGQLRITTWNTPLSNINSSQRWRVEPVSGYYTIEMGSGNRYLVKFDAYYIERTSTGTWTYTGISKRELQSGSSTGQETNWAFNFTLRQVGGTNLTYNTVMNSTFEKSGYSGGLSGYFGFSLSDEISVEAPLKFKPACLSENKGNLLNYYGGVEVINIDFDVAVEYGLADVVAKCLWKEPSSCLTHYELSYNGYTYDSYSQNVSEE